ncbi:hypothetical protein OIU76_017053 [Salix suchowensis]|nr:nuclear receptor family group protein [Salix suchowensis]KAJ6307186.1 hypothetical protein OIU76_017053 [Salix suchowensis]KAJ6340824.1 hypothetical protein OIU78_009071 [Salix suchowensis]
MARKRKVESSAAIVDESDKVLYSAFRNSANELSQLYSQAISYNKLSFEAGQRHALEKLSNWIAVKQQGGMMVTTEDISTYLQSELNNISNASYDSHGDWNELNSSNTTPVVQSQDKNLCFSFDSEMDTTPEGSAL